MNNFINELDNYILVINSIGNIEFCNKALLLKLNYEIDEIRNNNISCIFHNYKNVDNIILSEEKNEVFRLVSKDDKALEFTGKVYSNPFNLENMFFIVLKEENKIDIIKETLDYFPFNVWIKDIEGKFKYVNKEFEKKLKKSKDELIEKSASDFFEEDNSRYFECGDAYTIKSKKIHFNEECINIDQQERCFETYKIPIINKYGEVEYTAGISKDVTLSKKLESQIKSSHNNLSTVNNVLEINNEAANTVLSNIKDELIEYLKADGASIWLYDNNKESLIPYLKIGLANNIFEGIDKIEVDRKYLHKNLCYHMKEGVRDISEVNWVNDKNLIDKYDIKYFGVYKIIFNDEVLGMLLISYKSLSSFLEIKDTFIKNICNQIAILVRNNNLSLQLKKELNNRISVEDELQYFLDIAADLMAVIGTDKKIHKINGRWSKILGWEERELLSIDWREIVDDKDLNKVVNLANHLRVTDYFEDVSLSIRLKCKNGNKRWINWNGKYVKEKEIYIVTGKDITEQKLAESKNKSFKKALEVESIKNEFFANISHEFKTPLNIILATIQLINTYIYDDKITVSQDIDLNKYIKSIKQNSYRLLRLANNLIDMTKIDSGYYKINLENHNIVSIVEDITISVAEYIQNKDRELIFDTDIEEKIIACDPDKIERIMLNLLSNAVKYTEINDSIYVNLSYNNNWVIVSVKDTGIGIPEDKIDVIFNRFIQIDSTLARKWEGSGIGLSLVKSLIEMHHGEISVESKEGKGTEFTFKLPIRCVENNYGDKIIKNDHINSVEKCNIEFSDIYDIQ